MKKIKLFAIALGLIAVSACGSSSEEEKKESKKEDNKTEEKSNQTVCSGSDESGSIEYVVTEDEDGKVKTVTIVSTMSYEYQTKKEVESMVASAEQQGYPEGVEQSFEIGEDSYTIKLSFDIAKTTEEGLQQYTGSFPMDKVNSAKDFIKALEEKDIVTCK